jgi:hypothetical protein
MENAYFDSLQNIRSVQYNYNHSTQDIEIEMPYFWDYIGTLCNHNLFSFTSIKLLELDPNFQVLVNPYQPPGDCDIDVHVTTENKKNIRYFLFYFTAFDSCYLLKLLAAY